MGIMTHIDGLRSSENASVLSNRGEGARDFARFWPIRPGTLQFRILETLQAEQSFQWLGPFFTGDDLLDPLDRLRVVDVPPDALDGIPAHRVARLRRQGDHTFVRDWG